MARSRWLGQNTRIPFAGIVAMVLIVAVVAVFLWIGLEGTSSDVRVYSENDVRESLRGSASFVGERDIALLYKERLFGLLTSNGASRTFLVDVPARMLLVSQGGREEEVVLSLSKDGRGLEATFEHNGKQTKVVVLPGERSLVWHVLTDFPVDVALSDIVSYEGFFLYNNQQHVFKYHPNGGYAVIGTGSEYDEVSLTLVGKEFTGVWYDNEGTSHPVAVEPGKLKAVVGELW